MQDFESKRVDELRQYLIDNHKYTEEQVKNIKGKSNLVEEITRKDNEKISLRSKTVSPEGVVKVKDELDEAIDQMLEMEVDNSLEAIFLPETNEDASGEDANEEIVHPHIPTMPMPTDPEWTNYILSHLVDDEKDGNYPKRDGLRRLTEVFVGEIIDVSSAVHMAPSLQNGNYASVTVAVTVVRPNGEIVKMDGCADASDSNMEKAYRRFPMSVAQSRAEARAYTRLLRLKTIAAEEIINEDDASNNVDIITDKQIKTIEKICERTNISIPKLLAKHDLEGVSLESLKESKAKELCGILFMYEMSGAPEDILNESQLSN